MRRSTRLGLVIPLLIACAPEAIAPVALQSAPPGTEALLDEVPSVATLIVRPAEGSASSLFGVLHVWVSHPPNPVLPTLPPSPVCPLSAVQQPDQLLLCGHLRNAAGETLQNAELTITVGGVTEIVRMNFATPPNPVEPCENLFVRATAAVSLVGINPGPPNISAVLASNVGELVAITPGPPNDTEADLGPEVIITPAAPTNPACVATLEQ